MIKYFIIVILFFVSPGILADKPLSIVTVNYPLAYFAERIAGKHAIVVFPISKDIDPAFWEPDINTVIQYQKADLIILNGANYAQWINKVSLPPSKMVNTSSAFRDQYIQAAGTVTHQHGPAGEHLHAGIAFTTWLDLQQATQQANSIKKALVKIRPEFTKTFDLNYSALEKELLAIDHEFQLLFSKIPSQPLIASHPVYQYLARRYNLNLKNVHWEPNEMPENSEWEYFSSILREHPARWMIWEAEPAAEIIDRLKEFGVNTIVFNPCSNYPEEGDFMEVMLKNKSVLEQLDK